MTKELVSLLNDEPSLAAAFQIEQALQEAKVRIQGQFWAAMEESLRQRLALADHDFIPWKPCTRARLESYYAGDNGSGYFGIVVRLGPADATRSLALFVFVDKHIYYGLTPFEANQQVHWPGDSRWVDIRHCVSRAMPDCRKDVWALWVLPRVKLNFRAFSPTCLKLVNPDERTQKTREIADEIGEMLDRLRGELNTLQPALPVNIGKGQ